MRGGGGLSTYVVYLPWVMNMMHCKVLGYPAIAHSAGWFREHPMYRNYHSRVAVVQERKDMLPHCSNYDVHLSARRMIKHQRTERCDKNEHMWWRRKDATIARRYTEAYFSLTGEDGAECLGEVEVFNYLGQPLEKSDDDLPAVHCNIWKARQVWVRLRKILKR